MRPIQILSPQVANQIAAGEVVERPASIVKELVENSIDAGASHITIEVTEGGKELLVIRDNGSGIPRDQLDLALAPHATSKLNKISDLADLVSYGFRGEALASISSVSKLSLISRVADAESGWKIYNEGKEYRTSSSPIAHPVGTSIEVAELFYNTPARRKFLKSSTVEYNHIEDLIKRMAIVRPQIDWTLSHNGRQKLRLRGLEPTSYKERILQIFPQHFSDHALQLQAQIDTFNLNLEFVVETDRYFGIKSSSVQYCYINNRLVKDKVIISAMKQVLMELFGHTQLSYVLFINIDPQMLDVNVHPSKTEVRFVDSHKVHSFVFQNILVQLATLLHREQQQIEDILKSRAEDETLLDQQRLAKLQAEVKAQELNSNSSSNLAIDNPSLRSNLAHQLELEAQQQDYLPRSGAKVLSSSGNNFSSTKTGEINPTLEPEPKSYSGSHRYGSGGNKGANYLIDRFKHKSSGNSEDEIAGLKATIALFKQDFAAKKQEALGTATSDDPVADEVSQEEVKDLSLDLSVMSSNSVEQSHAILDNLTKAAPSVSSVVEDRIESKPIISDNESNQEIDRQHESVLPIVNSATNKISNLTDKDIHNIYQSNNFTGAELSLLEEQELSQLPEASILKQDEIATKFGFKSDHYLDKITKQQVQLELLQNLGEVSRTFSGTPLNKVINKQDRVDLTVDSGFSEAEDELLTSSLPPTLEAKLDQQFGLGELERDLGSELNESELAETIIPQALSKQFSLSPIDLQQRVDNLIACVEMLVRLRNKKAAEQNLEVQLSRKIAAELETVELNPAVINLVSLDLNKQMPLLAHVFSQELSLEEFSIELNLAKPKSDLNSLAWLEIAKQANLQVLTAQQQQSLIQVAQKIYLIPNKLFIQSVASFISEQMLAYGQMYLSLVSRTDSDVKEQETEETNISASLRATLASLETEQWQGLLNNLAGLETYFSEQVTKFADPNLYQASIMLLEQLGFFTKPAQLLKFMVPLAQEIL